MNPKKIWSNLTVSDLDRTTKFYATLGFKSNGRSADLTSFFIGENNFVMHFFLEDKLKANVEIEISDAHIANEVIFTLSAESEDEVNEWEEAVEIAGGKIVSKAQKFGEGYYGLVFSDPDGHKFNVFYM
ncbi:glyoxalase [Pedobacter ginsengisoli]|uniref:Glyoxalase n=1 Tax=Pedobacter ginsengisoli TaxID=363852 RepID=A0A2D1U3G2_9SPHI|nr:VOC family protein [Pedobacter ginsengisoli]ATP56145.1 glyoxalase [Pedobacter ginsengisoli]